ncbi:hypothetical protein ACN268_10120 [Micromonospora sp. WMMD735]|uniref:hypothetical protein n=1 Tax=Micromonospora sp. WMMD735 TaxID=3404130 RepID=UPI003B923173
MRDPDVRHHVATDEARSTGGAVPPVHAASEPVRSEDSREKAVVFLEDRGRRASARVGCSPSRGLGRGVAGG